MEARRTAQLEDANPFDVQDSHELEMNNPDDTNISDDSEESSDSSLSESSSDNEDHGGLHVPKSLNDYELKKMEKRRKKEFKRKEKEYKKKTEKTRSSKISSNGGEKKEGGFLRNSVLVQKTLNFFGRKSKPLLVKDSDEELEAENQGFQRKSDYKPEVQDFFVETANKNGSQGSEKENVFQEAQKEKDLEYFQNNDNEDTPFGEDEEAEEHKSPDNKPIFNYGRKHSIGLPPMHKAKSKVQAKPLKAKKLIAPPKPSNKFRHSVLEKPDLLDLLEN